MKPLLVLIAAAAACLALTESRVSLASIRAVELSVNEKFSAHGPDPWDLLGNARGTYLDGYGALFTFELDLVNAGGLTMSPFHRTTPEDIVSMRERKMKKLPEFKDAMRSLMMDASTTLEGLPANERISLEATLFSYSWEKDAKEMPRRILMTAQKQKLLDARASHATPAELANMIQEQDQ